MRPPGDARLVLSALCGCCFFGIVKTFMKTLAPNRRSSHRVGMKTKSPLPWFGSDASVAKNLGGYLDHCKHVTIPFCGGMGMLPHLQANAIVANDKHDLAINFYRVLSSHRDKLIRMCERTLSHPAELRLSQELIKDGSQSDDLMRAWAFWAVCWIGRKGKGGTKQQGGKPSVRRTASGGNNATRLAAAASDLEGWAEQFRRCEWTSEDWSVCLGKVADRPDCGLYVDPPWFGAGDSYLHTFS